MSSSSNSSKAWKYADAEVVDGVADVVDSTHPPRDVTTRSDDSSQGICNWTGTFRNPAFWILIGVVGTIGFQYVFRKVSKV